jgi:hypothetical protein
VDLTQSEVAREVRAALVDALRTKNQQFVDNVLINLILFDDCDADILERLHREALFECPKDVIDFWLAPCPCGACPN